MAVTSLALSLLAWADFVANIYWPDIPAGTLPVFVLAGIGLALGIVAMIRKARRGLAVTGIVLSLLVLSIPAIGLAMGFLGG